MKLVRILLLVPFLMAFQCDEDTALIEDPLIDTGLLGRWEIADETVNGINDLLPKSGRFFEFNPDDNPDDLQGLFSFTEVGGVYSGVFTVDEVNQTILFQRDERDPVIFVYSINSRQDYLTFTFIEDDVEWVQGWARRD